MEPLAELLPQRMVQAVYLVRLAERGAHLGAERVVGLAFIASDAEHREPFVDEMLLHQLINRRQQLATAQVSERTTDDHGARIGAAADDGLRLSRGASRNDWPVGAHECFTAWPPNSLRSAAITFAPNESACRERKRVCSDNVITGAGTSRSIASCTVQRPSPESATHPLMSDSDASRANAFAASSLIQERT